jgi:hypothetical protein
MSEHDVTVTPIALIRVSTAFLLQVCSNSPLDETLPPPQHPGPRGVDNAAYILIHHAGSEKRQKKHRKEKTIVEKLRLA